MKDFIVSLYANESFPIYLGAIILVLLVAFFIVFFLGKKDQKKIEMTQRLDAISNDAFKNVSSPVAVEAPVVQQPMQQVQAAPTVAPVAPMPGVQFVQETPVQMPAAPAPVIQQPAAPVVNEVSNIQPIVPEVPVAPVVPEPLVYTAPVEAPTMPVQPVYSEPVVPEMPVNPVMPEPIVPTMPLPEASAEPIVPEHPLMSSEPVAPVVNPVTTPVYEETIAPVVEAPVIPEVSAVPDVPKFNPDPVIEPYIPETDLQRFDDLANSISNELKELEKQQTIAGPVVDSNPTKVMTGVFSSVYAPKKEEQSIDETMEIELPKLKSEPVLSEEPEESLKL